MSDKPYASSMTRTPGVSSVASDITDEMIERAAEQIYGSPKHHFTMAFGEPVEYTVAWGEVAEKLGQDERAVYLRQARRILEAGLAGRTVVELPVDPTTIPDPRRWGTEFRTSKRQRVYWDASLHARHENAWTNIARTERFSADCVRGDADRPPKTWRAEVAQLRLQAEQLMAEARRLAGSVGSETPAPVQTSRQRPGGSPQPDAADCPLTPFCDRKPGHPGICMTRCSKTVGCTERIGHRGRCTRGTFNEISWRVGSETPAAGE